MSTQPVFTFTNTDQSPRTFVANGLRGPAGPNTINSSTALAYSGLTMANGDWNLVVANAAGSGFNRLDMSATARSLLGVASGAALLAVLGTGTADNTTVLQGDGTWVAKSSITTTDASLLTSGTLADARLSANVALRNAANIFTVGGQQINSASASSVPLTIKGTTSQSGNLTQWQDVNGVTFARVNSSRQFSNNGGVPNSEAFGNGAVVSSTGGTAIGSGATAAGSAVAVVRLANGNTQSAVALGAGAIANAVGALAMGQNASATGVGAISIGNNSQAAGAGGAMIGAGQDSRANTLCYFGSGTPPTFSLIGTTPALGQGRPIVDFVSAWADSTDATRRGMLSIGVHNWSGLQSGFDLEATSSGPVAAVYCYDLRLTDGATGANNQWGFNAYTDGGPGYSRVRLLSLNSGYTPLEAIRNTNSLIMYGGVSVLPVSASQVPLTIQAAASQTANLTEWQNSSGTAGLVVTSAYGIGSPVSAFDGLIQFGAGIVNTSIYGFTNLKFTTQGYYGGTGNGGAPGYSTTSVGAYSWSNDSLNSDATRDTVLLRVAAGVVGVTDHGSSNDVGFRLQRRSSTTNDRNVGQILASWATSTDATRAGQLSLGVYSVNTLQEGIRIVADATTPYVYVPTQLQVGTTSAAASRKFAASSNASNTVACEATHTGTSGSNYAFSVGAYGSNASGVNIGLEVYASGGGTNKAIIVNSGGVWLSDGVDLVFGTSTGTKIGTSTSQKLGFYGETPVVKPTGVAVDAAGIHAALVTLGLIAA